MNQTITLNGGGLSLGVAVAGALLAYSVWLGRRDLGLRAAWGILAATVLSSLVSTLMLLAPFRQGLGSFSFVLLSVLSPLLNFLPLYVAANWLGIIRQAAQHSNA